MPVKVANKPFGGSCETVGLVASKVRKRLSGKPVAFASRWSHLDHLRVRKAIEKYRLGQSRRPIDTATPCQFACRAECNKEIIQAAWSANIDKSRNSTAEPPEMHATMTIGTMEAISVAAGIARRLAAGRQISELRNAAKTQAGR